MSSDKLILIFGVGILVIATIVSTIVIAVDIFNSLKEKKEKEQ